jgi:hypothetical protein
MNASCGRRASLTHFLCIVGSLFVVPVSMQASIGKSGAEETRFIFAILQFRYVQPQAKREKECCYRKTWPFGFAVTPGRQWVPQVDCFALPR